VIIQPSQHAHELGIDRGSTGLWQTLKRLQTRASLLMITAHPDDEDGGLLTLESRGRGTRTMLLCLTRGEGGANVMSNDFFDALGLVRTEELLAANRYYGVQQYWSRAIDYGFSKTREEAFDKWGYQRVLYDAVRVIRLTRPLVVVSVFIGEATDGHGNHRTTGQLAQEAFALAGDPDAFPDQLQAGLEPWTPLKMYGRVPRSLQEGNLDEKGLFNYATQKWEPAGYRNYIEDTWTPGVLATTVEVPSGDYDPVLGRSYLQIAREGLGMQKCQMGGASVPPAGAFSVPYHRFASRVPAEDREATLFDGVDISLLGLAAVSEDNSGFVKLGLSKITSSVDKAARDFSIQHPEHTAPALVEGLKLTNALIEDVTSSELPEEAKSSLIFELLVKRSQFNTALSQALGLSLSAVVTPEGDGRGPRRGLRGPQPTFRVAIPEQEFNVSVSLTKRSGAPVQVSAMSLVVSEDDGWEIEATQEAAKSLNENEPVNARFRVRVSSSPTYTRPYFGRPDVAQAYYDILDDRYLNLSHRPYPLTAWVDLSYSRAEIRLGQVVQTAERIPGLGTVQNPLVVGPAISVSLSPQSGVAPIGGESFNLGVTIHSNVKGSAEGTVRLNLPDSWRSIPETQNFSTARDGEQRSVSFQVLWDIQDCGRMNFTAPLPTWPEAWMFKSLRISRLDISPELATVCRIR
jgi:LmbE family N-acetylglucosaminyl deacetylase